MEDIYFKMKYTKCKLKVKKWESEFKKEHGTNPSKNDIKSAPPFIKEAYKIYYNLKTMALENSLLGSILGDEDTMDSFSASINNSDISNSMNNLNSNTEKLNIKINNKISCVEEYPNSESNILPYDSSNIKANIQQECKELSFEIDINNHNKDTVWGPHLRKKPKEKKQSIIPSSSLSYTAKLFPGAKFNKRNPRKSHTFTKTKKLNESINESTSVFHSENSLSSYDPKGFILQPLPDNNTDLVGCNIVDNKIKITKATIPVVSQPVSLIHKTLNNPNNEILTLRKLDTGWVERTAQSNLLEISQISNISDSGINLKDSNVLSNNLNDVKLVMNSGCSTIEASDDEDFIYDSDSEKESKHKLNISRVSLKRSFDSLNNIFDDSQSKRYKSETKNINCIKSQTKLVNKSYLNNSVFETKDVKNTSTTLVTNCSNIPNSSNKPFNTKDLKIISTTLVDGEYSSSVNEGSETTEKVKRKISGVTLVDKCSSILENSEPEVEVKKKTARSKLSLQERLELKMASGKANENFVKVNIQKKVFVRGKKTMTFSKFKKKQWKANQKSLHGGKGGGGRGGHAGILKCFKCGDVGHFSRACMKAGDQLLPKAEDGDEEDESPFPTLEEAEEMAKECAERLHIKKKDVEDQINIDEVNSVEEDETALLLQPEPIEEQSFQSGIEPIFQVNEDGTLIETPLIVLDALMKFGHEKFRPGQEKVIMRILSGLSTLVTLATGTGKSLCYQLPAYIYHKYRKCITLVVSPLVSLMEDQVAKSSPCLNIACLHANQTPKKREQVLELLKNNELTVLLVSPEAVVQGERIGMNNFLRDLPPVAFACVDEAHCVSQWSHNFRPSYLSIFQVLREKMGVKTILGLTATATINTMSSIATHIGVPDGVQGIFRDTPLPNNLILSVSKEKRKDLALITLLKGPRFSSCESIIVYCTRREECERISAFLRTCLQDVSKEDGIDKRGKISWNAEAYHAGLRPGRRQLIQNAFMAGKLRIVIATVAFGMGINKKDIRGIVHYNMPSTFESYVQEVGRAGRDGLPAHCHLFLDSEGRDLNELRRHIYSNSTERHTIRKLLQRVFVPCRCKNTCPRHEVAFSIQATVEALDLRQENIATLLCYLELHKQNWAKVLSPVYTLCRIHSYKGAKYLKKAAKECAPLAMAIAMELKRSTKLDNMKMLQFSVYDVAAAINWDSGIVKYHLKNLEWTKVNNQPKRSGLVVELTELGFRLRAPGNLSSDELDSALDSLYNRVKMQETTSLKKLQAIFQALVEASYKSVEDCLDRVETERCETLKLRIRDYFSKEGELDKISLPEPTLDNEEQIVADIRNLIFSYRDCTFTGRAIARIFHGIESPNFPALVWYSCRYWREHLNQNFNALCKGSA